MKVTRNMAPHLKAYLQRTAKDILRPSTFPRTWGTIVIVAVAAFLNFSAVAIELGNNPKEASPAIPKPIYERVLNCSGTYIPIKLYTLKILKLSISSYILTKHKNLKFQMTCFFAKTD